MTTETTNLSITATLPNALVLQSQANSALEIANEYVIDSDFMYNLAADELKDIKSRIAKLNEQRMGITRPMDEAKKRIIDLFRHPADVLEQAAKQLEQAMLGYQKEKRRIAQEAQRKLDEEARKEQHQLMEQAEAAKSAGNTALAATFEAAATIATAPVIVEETPKAKGVSTRKNYKAEIVDRVEFVKWVAAHPEHIDLVMGNMPELNKRASALKEAMAIPGIRIVATESIATRRS